MGQKSVKATEDGGGCTSSVHLNGPCEYQNTEPPVAVCDRCRLILCQDCSENWAFLHPDVRDLSIREQIACKLVENLSRLETILIDRFGDQEEKIRSLLNTQVIRCRNRTLTEKRMKKQLMESIKKLKKVLDQISDLKMQRESLELINLTVEVSKVLNESWISEIAWNSFSVKCAIRGDRLLGLISRFSNGDQLYTPREFLNRNQVLEISKRDVVMLHFRFRNSSLGDDIIERISRHCAWRDPELYIVLEIKTAPMQILHFLDYVEKEELISEGFYEINGKRKLHEFEGLLDKSTLTEIQLSNGRESFPILPRGQFKKREKTIKTPFVDEIEEPSSITEWRERYHLRLPKYLLWSDFGPSIRAKSFRSLNSDNLKKAQIIEVAKSIRENILISELSLDGIDFRTSCGDQLLSSLAMNRTLGSTFFFDCRINRITTLRIEDFVKLNPNLQKFEAMAPGFSTLSPHALPKMLKFTNSISSLRYYLASPYTTQSFPAAEFNSSLTIEQLELSSNPMSDDAMRRFCIALRDNQTIRVLSLTYMDIGDTGAICLSRFVANSKVLVRLNLSGNEISNRGACALAEALKANKSLMELELGNISIVGGGEGRITSLGAKAFADAFRFNETLIYLDLSGSKIGDEGTTALAETLRENSTLQELKLLNNSIGIVGARKLFEFVGRTKALRKLHLTGNPIPHGYFQQMSHFASLRGIVLGQIPADSSSLS